jgi:hypothetical protein
MNGNAGELSRKFRVWSIYAFALESIAVIFAFFVMVFFLRGEINQTMMYVLLLVMVVSAAVLLVTGRTVAGK